MASNHDDWWTRLVSGPTERIGSLPASTADEAGVFTIWYRGVLVHYGRAGNAAESRASNHQQADGARGRVRSLARQPGRPLQRLLADNFPEDWQSVNESTDVSRARALLRRDGECRIMRFGSRHEAETAYDSVASRLAQLHGKQPA